ncbi:MAG: hypothetical protein ABWX68_12855 [Arthrobacter sp.]|uniref:hypothetical protein n=1 Tax=Arthrobacter sp. TaxID=1667 RepID=UPI00347F1787
MGTCDMRGNEDRSTFTLNRAGETKTFDGFECASHMKAPTCRRCRCRVLGHGLEVPRAMYRCSHRAREAGHEPASVRA